LRLTAMGAARPPLQPPSQSAAAGGAALLYVPRARRDL